MAGPGLWIFIGGVVVFGSIVFITLSCLFCASAAPKQPPAPKARKQPAPLIRLERK